MRKKCVNGARNAFQKKTTVNKKKIVSNDLCMWYSSNKWNFEQETHYTDGLKNM